MLPVERINNPVLSPRISRLNGVSFFNIFISNLITIFLIGATIVALFFLITGGIKWITSGGDREGVAQAQKTVTSAAIGLIVVFCAYAVLRLIGYFFDLNLISINIAPLILR